MTHFKVKVCGVTRQQDAQYAARLGADMIGLIMYSLSPRHVSMSEAKAIVSSLPVTVDRVGVMVEPSFEQAIRVTEWLHLDYVQLHGKIKSRMVTALRKTGLKVIRAFAVKSARDLREAAKSKADLVLLDSYTDDLYGGSGKPFDWSVSRSVSLPNLVLAGGVSVDNVANGVRQFKPLVVDVNSGVEKTPGVKSRSKLREFIRTCNKIRYGR